MQVSKWGNSLAVRLPASVVDALDLKEGDQIEIRASNRCERSRHRDAVDGGDDPTVATSIDTCDTRRHGAMPNSSEHDSSPSMSMSSRRSRSHCSREIRYVVCQAGSPRRTTRLVPSCS